MSGTEKFLVVVLDLDATCICSEDVNEFDLTKNKDKVKNFAFHDMKDYYIVFERPGLQEFLDGLFKDPNVRVCVWTAATKDYALFVLENIILKNKDRKLDYFFFNYHCDVSEKLKNQTTKNLSLLWDVFKICGYSKDNTVIIDDYDEVKKTQPLNAIEAVPFVFTRKGSEDDKFLKEKATPLVQKMKDEVMKGGSVQKILKEVN